MELLDTDMIATDTAMIVTDMAMTTMDTAMEMAMVMAMETKATDMTLTTDMTPTAMDMITAMVIELCTPLPTTLPQLCKPLSTMLLLSTTAMDMVTIKFEASLLIYIFYIHIVYGVIVWRYKEIKEISL